MPLCVRWPQDLDLLDGQGAVFFPFGVQCTSFEDTTITPTVLNGTNSRRLGVITQHVQDRTGCHILRRTPHSSMSLSFPHAGLSSHLSRASLSDRRVAEKCLVSEEGRSTRDARVLLGGESGSKLRKVIWSMIDPLMCEL